MNGFTLRPYQGQGIDLTKGKFKNGIKKVVLCIPTGGGKTVMFSAFTKKTLDSNLYKKVLILTHRVELMIQAGGTLSKFGITASSLTAETKNKDINFGARCMVAMVETYGKRLAKFPQLADYDLVIIDEAHFGGFRKIFRQWAKLGKDLFVIGATATPKATSKKDPLNNYYQDIVCPVTIDELIDIGSLVPARTYSAIFNRQNLTRDYSSEDGFSEVSQMAEFDKREVYAGLIEKFTKHCLKPDGTPRKTICFNVNVKHSKEVCKSFNEAGFRAIHVDGYMDKDVRRDILKAFDNGEYDILCNPNIVTAGYDNPAVEVVVFNRATKSLTMWLQACGRGSRPFPGKEFFIILDMAQNWSELRKWEAAHDWEAIFWDRPSNKPKGVAPSKECPECGFLNHAAATICGDSECGYVFPKPEKKEAANPDFIEITEAVAGRMTKERQAEILSLVKRGKAVTAMEIQELIDLAAIKGYKNEWIVRTLIDRCKTFDEFKSDVQYLADEKNYFQPWVDRKLDWFKQQRQLA